MNGCLSLILSTFSSCLLESVIRHIHIYHCNVFSFFKLIYLFLAALGLCCCAWAFSSCGERGLLSLAVHRFLIAVASLVAEHGP